MDGYTTPLRLVPASALVDARCSLVVEERQLVRDIERHGRSRSSNWLLGGIRSSIRHINLALGFDPTDDARHRAGFPDPTPTLAEVA